MYQEKKIIIKFIFLLLVLQYLFILFPLDFFKKYKKFIFIIKKRPF